MTTKAQIVELALRIEGDRDDAPDYETEKTVALALGLWRPTSRGTLFCEIHNVEFADHKGALYPGMFGSLDRVVAAIPHVLPGWEWLKKTPRVMTLYRPPAGKAFARHIDGTGLDDSRALCVAMLRAFAADRFPD